MDKRQHVHDLGIFVPMKCPTTADHCWISELLLVVPPFDVVAS